MCDLWWEQEGHIEGDKILKCPSPQTTTTLSMIWLNAGYFPGYNSIWQIWLQPGPFPQE